MGRVVGTGGRGRGVIRPRRILVVGLVVATAALLPASGTTRVEGEPPPERALEAQPGPLPERPATGRDRRGCGWFLAYEPGVLQAARRASSDAGLDEPRRRVLEAAVLGDTDALRAALAAGAPADVVLPGFRYTPLGAAVSAECASAVSVLLRAGANPDLRTPGGDPPLAIAVLVGDATSVAALLDAGADPRATTARGVDVLDVARLLDRPRIVTLLAGDRGPAATVPVRTVG